MRSAGSPTEASTTRRDAVPEPMDPHAAPPPALGQPSALLARLGRPRPESVGASLAALVEGEVVGMQDIDATDFPTERTIRGHGSWIGREHQARGLGARCDRPCSTSSSRASAPRWPYSAAVWADNLASQRVSEKCGYVRDGREPCTNPEGRASVGLRLERGPVDRTTFATTSTSRGWTRRCPCSAWPGPGPGRGSPSKRLGATWRRRSPGRGRR